MSFDVREPASKSHTVPGIQHNLLSTANVVDAGYAWLFENDEVQVIDKKNTNIIISRAAVMKGWRVPGENLWRVPIVKENNQTTFDNSNTVLMQASPVELLQNCPPPKPETVANIYDLKTQPKLVRYYHTAADFPTKPIWMAAIINGHYRSWPGLTENVVRQYFPDSSQRTRQKDQIRDQKHPHHTRRGAQYH